MGFAAFKVALAAVIIAFASWLSKEKPHLAGFIIALPLASILALAFGYVQHQDSGNAAEFARSILVAIPFSLLFFVPFFFPEKWGLGFWMNWGLGLAFLTAGYFTHQWVMRFF